MLESDENPSAVRLRRKTGFQTPLHPLQIFGWIVLLLLIIGTFTLLVPALPKQMRSPVATVLIVFTIGHISAHLAATLLDPAEPVIRIRNLQPLPHLDKTKYPHAINEFGECNICKIPTSGKKTKHCGICNKCVQNFDHHCKWLNQCIGRRNYLPFLICVTTAIFTTLIITIITVIDLKMTATSTKPKADDIKNVNASSEYSFINDPFVSLGYIPYYVLVSIIGLVAAIICCLLIHLCFFHIYISIIGVTTYEFIKQHQEPRNIKQRCTQYLESFRKYCFCEKRCCAFSKTRSAEDLQIKATEENCLTCSEQCGNDMKSKNLHENETIEREYTNENTIDSSRENAISLSNELLFQQSYSLSHKKHSTEIQNYNYAHWCKYVFSLISNVPQPINLGGSNSENIHYENSSKEVKSNGNEILKSNKVHPIDLNSSNSKKNEEV